MSCGNKIFRKFKQIDLSCHYVTAQRMLRKTVLVGSVADGRFTSSETNFSRKENKCRQGQEKEKMKTAQ